MAIGCTHGELADRDRLKEVLAEWLGHNGKQVDQSTFAEFLEDNSPDITRHGKHKQVPLTAKRDDNGRFAKE